MLSVIRLHPVLYDMHKDLRLALSYQLMVHGSLSPVVVERALQAVERQTIECARAPEQAVLYTPVHFRSNLLTLLSRLVLGDILKF